MKIALGSDHAGFQYKERIKLFLSEAGHEVADFGTDSQESVDYPSFILSVAQAVAQGDFERGVVLGGSGNGEAIAANRVVGIRCTLCWNLRSARLARQHNNANVLALGQRMMRLERALGDQYCFINLEPFMAPEQIVQINFVPAFPSSTAWAGCGRKKTSI